MKKTRIRATVGALFVFGAVAGLTSSGQDATKATGIEDYWTQVYTELEGTRFPNQDSLKAFWTRSPAQGQAKVWKPYVWKIGKEIIEEGRGTKESPFETHRYQRDLAGKAGTIDLIDVEPDAKKNTHEKRKLGLYYQIDDFLMIAWNPPGEPRPDSLMTQPKSKTTMVILRRGILK